MDKIDIDKLHNRFKEHIGLLECIMGMIEKKLLIVDQFLLKYNMNRLDLHNIPLIDRPMWIERYNKWLKNNYNDNTQ